MTDVPDARALHPAVVKLAAAHQALKDADAAVNLQVRAAREIGATWPEIGGALRMIAANASRKYGPIPTGGPAADKVTRKAAVAELAKLRKRRVTAKIGVAQAVADARDAKVSWDAIAPVLGQHKPNAYVKYMPLLREDRRVTLRKDLVRRWAETT